MIVSALPSFAGMLPAAVVHVCRPIGGDELLHWAEASLVSSAVVKRRRAFCAGRRCGHDALAGIGRDGDPILRGPLGEPLWPEGIVGSITHGGQFAAAAVTCAHDVWSLGIDIEPLDPALSVAAKGLALSPLEQESVASLPRPDEAAKIVFSAKESVYKSISRVVGRVLEFRDVQIELWPDGTFGSSLSPRIAEKLPDNLRELSTYRVRAGHILTSCTHLWP